MLRLVQQFVNAWNRCTIFRAALAYLWDEEIGFYSNRRLDTGAWNRRSSPTNFYSLLGHAAKEAQAARMLQEHFHNPDEFWGEWILPTTPRNDPAFTDQDHWGGLLGLMALIEAGVVPGGEQPLAQG